MRQKMKTLFGKQRIEVEDKTALWPNQQDSKQKTFSAPTTSITNKHGSEKGRRSNAELKSMAKFLMVTQIYM